MDLYIIDEDVEIKPPRIQRRGRPSSNFVQEYNKLQNWIGKKYLNHGNNMAHTLKLVFNQLNKERDLEVFTEDGRSLNLYISRGLYFSKRCATLYTDQQNPTHRKRSSKNLGLFISPALYLYDRAPIEELVEEKKCVLYAKAIPSYDHGCDVQTYEYRLNHRLDLPAPRYIITGRAVSALRKTARIDYDQYTQLVAKIFPNTILIHTPHISFGVDKKRHETGNGKTPLTGKRILDILYNIESGKYKAIKKQVE